jgi:hypothetical protein
MPSWLDIEEEKKSWLFTKSTFFFNVPYLEKEASVLIENFRAFYGS